MRSISWYLINIDRGEALIDSKQQSSSPTPSGASASGASSLVRWLIKPLVRILDQHYAPHFEGLAQKSSSNESEIGRLREQTGALTDITTRLDQILEASNAQIRESQQGIAEDRNRLADLDDRLSSLTGAVSHLTETARTSAEKIKALDDRSTEDGHRIDTLSTSVSVHEKELRSASESIKRIDAILVGLEELRTQISTDSAQIDAISVDLKGLRTQISTDSAQIDAISVNLEGLRTQISTDSAQIDAISVNLEELRTKSSTDSARIDAVLRTLANLEESAALPSPGISETELKLLDERLGAIQRAVDQKPDMATVKGVGETQQRVLTHLAALQNDHDEVKAAHATTQAQTDQTREPIKQLMAQTSELRATMSAFQETTDSRLDLAAEIPGIQDRLNDLASFLADAARERTILAEELDRRRPEEEVP